MDTLGAAEHVTCRVISETAVECNGTEYSSDSRYVPGDTWFWIYLAIYIVLVLLAGVFSGLTLGLLSLDTTTLQVMIRAGTAAEQKNARRIMPLIKRHHLLLVTLLLANAAAVESMPLFMNKISNEVVAIVVSVTAVLLFGEVFPQALCSRYGLAIGAFLVPLVWFLIALFFVIAWPISKLLDCLLGKDHATFYRRAEIKAIVDIHGEDVGSNQHTEEDPLTHDEVLIIKSALDMKTKVGGDAMVPISSVFMLHIDARLDAATMKQISEASHSRIPIYEHSRENIVAMLLVKTIIALDPDDAVSVRELVSQRAYCRKLFMKPANTPLYDLLNEFQKGKSHMCLMTRERPADTPDGAANSVQADVPCILVEPDNKQEIVGVITLEDVIEELLGEEIIDETDVYSDVHRRVRVARAKRASIQPQTSNMSTSVSRQVSAAPSTRSTDSPQVYTASDDETVKLLDRS